MADGRGQPGPGGRDAPLIEELPLELGELRFSISCGAVPGDRDQPSGLTEWRPLPMG